MRDMRIIPSLLIVTFHFPFHEWSRIALNGANYKRIRPSKKLEEQLPSKVTLVISDSETLIIFQMLRQV